MAVTVVVGAQWGDEGKGKVVDRLAARADLVIRYQGGANAGHTIVRGGEKVALHLIPSGILHDHVRCAIGSGVVVDPEALLTERDGLHAIGVQTEGRLRISPGAHLVLPHHKALDAAREEAAGDDSIGTTRRGIGPCYADRTARVGIRAGDLAHPEALAARVEGALKEANVLLEHLYGAEPLIPSDVTAWLLDLAPQLLPLVGPMEEWVAPALADHSNILLEGAQGTLLDLDAGTYPFVTSSHPTTAGACIGTEVHPQAINRVIGIAKAYATRVGEGPFPSELEGEIAGTLVRQGHEFGTTTGRQRRCGWIDVNLLRTAVRLNGIDDLVMTKLDVLTGLDQVGIYDGEVRYVTGWQESLAECRNFEQLPPAAREFVQAIEREVGVPISAIGVGPDRDALIVRRDF
jgi:adenylosuccinate synthase